MTMKYNNWVDDSVDINGYSIDKHMFHVLRGGDILLNTLFSFGSSTHTVSARLYGLSRKGKYKHWSYLMRAIDWAFFPLDGEGHCYQAHEYEQGYYIKANLVALLLTALIISFFAPVIGVLTRSIVATKSIIAWVKRLIR